jgi:hypothetical protein
MRKHKSKTRKANHRRLGWDLRMKLASVMIPLQSRDARFRNWWVDENLASTINRQPTSKSRGSWWAMTKPNSLLLTARDKICNESNPHHTHTTKMNHCSRHRHCSSSPSTLRWATSGNRITARSQRAGARMKDFRSKKRRTGNEIGLLHEGKIERLHSQIG